MAKPRKVEEPAAPYSASPKRGVKVPSASAQPTDRYADDAVFRKAAAKVFKTHEELFRKLAQ